MLVAVVRHHHAILEIVLARLHRFEASARKATFLVALQRVEGGLALQMVVGAEVVLVDLARVGEEGSVAGHLAGVVVGGAVGRKVVRRSDGEPALGPGVVGAPQWWLSTPGKAGIVVSRVLLKMDGRRALRRLHLHRNLPRRALLRFHAAVGEALLGRSFSASMALTPALPAERVAAVLSRFLPCS